MTRRTAALAARRLASVAALSCACIVQAAPRVASATAQDGMPHLPPGVRLPYPVSREHVEFVVETNKKGQVVKVISGKQSPDTHFNAFVYGNALQAFIRTPDGHAIAGRYKLSYDYDPRTRLVHRDVGLIRAGGVNPDAEGAVDAMGDIEKRHALRALEAKAAATPLPNFRDITGHK